MRGSAKRASPHFSQSTGQISTPVRSSALSNILEKVSQPFRRLFAKHLNERVVEIYCSVCEKWGLARISHKPYVKFATTVCRSCRKHSSAILKPIWPSSCFCNLDKQAVPIYTRVCEKCGLDVKKRNHTQRHRGNASTLTPI